MLHSSILIRRDTIIKNSLPVVMPGAPICILVDRVLVVSLVGEYSEVSDFRNEVSD